MLCLVEKAIFRTGTAGGRIIRYVVIPCLIYESSTGTCFSLTNQGLRDTVLIWEAVK